LDYQFDWSDWLAEEEVLAAADFTVDDESGLTIETSGFTDTTATVWLSGGVTGQIGSIICRITTDSSPIARIDDRTLRLRIAER
jgi:hypothetical protein